MSHKAKSCPWIKVKRIYTGCRYLKSLPLIFPFSRLPVIKYNTVRLVTTGSRKRNLDEIWKHGAVSPDDKGKALGHPGSKRTFSVNTVASTSELM